MSDASTLLHAVDRLCNRLAPGDMVKLVWVNDNPWQARARARKWIEHFASTVDTMPVERHDIDTINWALGNNSYARKTEWSRGVVYLFDDRVHSDTVMYIICNKEGERNGW